jgi:uncharacterized membrane protein (UPF0127 family)
MTRFFAMTGYTPLLNPTTAWLAAAICMALLAAGCQKPAALSSPSGLPTVSMRIGSKTYTLEVAATDASRQHGLMRRDSMDPDHGMIFVFTQEQEVPFWMKDTRIPLFIVFLDHQGRVVSTAHMRPYDQHTTPSNGAALYAVELNDDQDRACGVKAGDLLVVPPGAQAPTAPTTTSTTPAQQP